MKQFQILNLSSDDIEIDKDSDPEFIITIYGKSNDVYMGNDDNEYNKNVVCHVEGFKPYFYLKYPSHWKNSFIRGSFWTKRFINIDENIYKHFKISEIVESYELYGFHLDENNNEKKYKFIKLEFINYENMKKVVREIKKYCKRDTILDTDVDDEITMNEFLELSMDNEYRFDSNLYESNIHPLLRFIHEKNLKTCGWVEINNEKLIEDDKKMFNVELEYKNIQLKDIKSIDLSDINKFIIASFDIECDSLHGDFPNPNKDFKKLAVDITDYYKKSPTVTSDGFCKSILIKNINDALNGGNENINSIELENGPISKESIEKVIDRELKDMRILLDNSKENSKERDKCVNKLKEIFKGFKNDKGDEIEVKGDPIIQIGTVFHKYGDDKPYNRSIVVMGPKEGMEDSEICEDLKNIGIEVLYCKNERELLLKWKDLILKNNPDYITGYNIFGFDFDYIIKRVEKIFKCTHKNCKYNHFTQTKQHHHKCDSHSFYRLGRLMKKREHDQYNNINLKEKNDYKIIQSSYFQHSSKKCCTVTKRLGGNDKEDDSDFSQNTLKYINMDGRIIFDVQNEVKKGTSLDSYKLDNVSSHFMRGKIIKKDRHKSLSTWIDTNNIGNLKEGDYISISITTKYGEMKHNNGEKYMVMFAENKSIRIKGVLNYEKKYGDNFVKAEWCLAKDDISPQELFDSHKVLHPIEGPKGRAKIAKYCIMDCELCINLLLLLDFIPNNMGMASVCFVPQPYIFLRGQGIKVQSLVTKYSNDNNIRVPTLKQFNEETDDNSGFEGAIVLEPKTGLYLEDPIAVLDYASLYPTSIKEKNLSHDTYFGEYNHVKDKLEKLGWEEKVDYNRIKYKDYVYEKKPGTSVVEKKEVLNEDGTHKEIDCVFISDTGKTKKKGIINVVVSALLEQRSLTKKLLKKEKNEDKKKVLDGYQLAYKLTANSVYGQLGAKTSSISFKKVAACTTAIGRGRIYDAATLVNKWTNKGVWMNNENYNGIKNIESEVVYGDTDSIFVKFTIKKENGITVKGKDALPLCIQCGKDSGTYITEQLHAEGKAPQDLEYEKTFWPFILISKKRYTGDKYEFTADETPKRTSMGLVTKRRDNAPIVKYVFGNMVNRLMSNTSVDEVIYWLKNTLQDIINGKEHISMFVISKTLNSYYKNPQSIAHKVLADRMGQRDPGNKPKANDRIPFAYIEVDDEQVPTGEYFKKDEIINIGKYKNGKPKTKKERVNDYNRPKYKKKKILQGERIEHPDYIKENKLPLDYKFYISNQIMNPVKQVLDISMSPEESKELFNIFLQ